MKTIIKQSANGIILSGDNNFDTTQGKVFINNHEITDIDTFFKVADENTRLLEQVKKQKEVIDKVRNIAYEYGQIDGDHHKTWVIDQMIRELLGTEYDNFIKEYEEDGEYTWDIGIAP